MRFRRALIAVIAVPGLWILAGGSALATSHIMKKVDPKMMKQVNPLAGAKPGKLAVTKLQLVNTSTNAVVKSVNILVFQTLGMAKGTVYELRIELKNNNTHPTTAGTVKVDVIGGDYNHSTNSYPTQKKVDVSVPPIALNGTTIAKMQFIPQFDKVWHQFAVTP